MPREPADSFIGILICRNLLIVSTIPHWQAISRIFYGSVDLKLIINYCQNEVKMKYVLCGFLFLGSVTALANEKNKDIKNRVVASEINREQPEEDKIIGKGYTCGKLISISNGRVALESDFGNGPNFKKGDRFGLTAQLPGAKTDFSNTNTLKVMALQESLINLMKLGSFYCVTGDVQAIKGNVNFLMTPWKIRQPTDAERYGL